MIAIPKIVVVFAHGGPEVITSKSRFMKAQDPYRTDIQRTGYGKSGKGGELSKLTEKTRPPKKGARK